MAGERRRLVKLVRSNVAKFLGGDVQVKYEPINDPQRLVEALRKKLVEEAVEYALDPSLEEMADVWEVSEALAALDPALGAGRPLGPCRGELAVKRAQAAKREERGGFEKGIGMYLNVAGDHEDDHAEPAADCAECHAPPGLHRDNCSRRLPIVRPAPARGSLGETLR